MKTTNNNDITINHLNKEVELYGHVAKIRDLGGIKFIDLRDRSGIIQLVIGPNNNYYNISNTIKNEYVLKVKGIVIKRQSQNNAIATGEIEIDVTYLEILNTSIELPFNIDEKSNVLEETKLKYRYLELRQPTIKNNLILRDKVTHCVRNFLHDLNFIEIETPILSKSTPEGARDYLVPSRVSNGKFYALPQSPQLYKQLLMIGEMEKYYQIAKCFRDEDLRSDRQPEFTQIDIEMSYVTENDIINITENLLASIFKTVKGINIKLPFKKLTYQEAMNNYGTDKPDLRFEMPIYDITNIFANSSFKLFNNKVINCLVVKNNAHNFSRKKCEELEKLVKIYNVSNLLYLKYDNNLFSGSIIKNISSNEQEKLKKELNVANNDIIFIISDEYQTTKVSLGALRNHLGKILNLINEDDYCFLWVVDFPMFEYDKNDKRYYSIHHPFTMVKDKDIDKLTSNPSLCLSKSYDIVLNGYELGGGSIRIHNQEIQNKVFQTLSLSKEDIKNKFGFFTEALQYGTPPHGGIALGLERLVMLLAKTTNIKDVIAFPKTASAYCMMMETPSYVNENQLKELEISIKKQDNAKE
ncbi:MAG: aspartate--tRNA ligase [bacterium]|nr:aspartate--tRNA ligase [bacterium]